MKIEVAKVNEIIHRMFSEATNGVEEVAEGEDLATIRGEVRAIQSLARKLRKEINAEHQREIGDLDLDFDPGIEVPEIDSAKLYGRYEEDKALERARDTIRPDLQEQEFLRENA